ncbi:ThiJ/PfpI domain-containing protein [Gottschalkia purinilytica]|uniref:ThiJ/PfpI domain-containing protein n=1 Tax=Gottschalkia purinilytica TaxID=1503 RepID=A0A0L0W8E4_GOTPU|nr:DJ-1/PfpI family protein [Gottschalkia purinilytica]KNF07721.1 ThiJ/PfpI domain-containing protein [Gottschalkia purinilytica]
MKKTKNVGILIFDEVEVLDFCGPFEVFSVSSNVSAENSFNVFTIAEKDGPIYARNNLSINPKYTIKDCPDIDILIVPGGQGARKEMHNQMIISWINNIYPNLELLLTVCTGALIVGKCGLLEGLTATTHHSALNLLKDISPNIKVVSDERYVDNGKIILSGGISAGIDMSLYVVDKLLGKEAVSKTIDVMEYSY